MKVLRSGKPSSAWSKKVICTGAGNGKAGCKAKFEISEEDVYITESHDYGGGCDSYYTVLCPECGCETDITGVSNRGRIPRKEAWLRIQNKKMKPEKLSLRDVKDFPKPGILFKDISPLLGNPEELRQLVKYLANEWEGKVNKIVGFDARGFIFGSLLAYEMNLPFAMLRKKGKLPGSCESVTYDLEYGSAALEIQSDSVKRGEKILLVDDLLATGGTALAGCKLVEKLGGKVAGIQFVIELKDLPGREALNHYDVYSVIQC